MKAKTPRALTLLIFTWGLFSLAGQSAIAAPQVLTLKQAEALALTNEPGMQSLQARTQSMIQRSIADGQLMDPKLQIGLLNLPTDSFDFNQEAMTQFKVSYIQDFPSGNTRQIKSEQSVKQSELFQRQGEDRKRSILKQVRLSFLEAWYLNQARQTVLKNQQLLKQLSAIVESQFSLGRNLQMDVLTVQLQQSKLDDQISQLEQKISQQRFALSEWIGESTSQYALQDELPTLLNPDWKSATLDEFESLLSTHPRVLEINTQLDLTRKEIELIREKEKPGWNLNVSYAYRDDAPNGSERADFVSAVVTFDLPLFTANRQHKLRESQQLQINANQDQRDALLRKMQAELAQLRVNEILIEERKNRYQSILIPQSNQRAEAAMQNYQSGNGTFSSVMQAYMDALNTELDAHRLSVDQLKNQASVLYLIEGI